MAHAKFQSYQVLQRNADNKARITQEDGNIVALPAGDSYTMNNAHNFLLRDIWVLARQSDMEGWILTDVEKPSPFVYSLPSREEQAVAEEPLHWSNESPRHIRHILLDADTVPDPLSPFTPLRALGAASGPAQGFFLDNGLSTLSTSMTIINDSSHRLPGIYVTLANDMESKREPPL